MSVNIIINILFFLSLFGLIIIISRRLPDIAEVDNSEYKGSIDLPKNNLFSKIYFSLKSFWLQILSLKGGAAHSSAPKRLQKLVYRQITKNSDLEESANLTTKSELDGDVKAGYNFDNNSELQTSKFESATPVANINIWNLETCIEEVEKNIKIANWEQALVWLNRIDQDIMSADPVLLAKRAQVYLMLTEYDLSIADYYASLEIDDSNATRYYNLTVALVGIADYSAALEAINKACQLMPGNQKYLNVKNDLESAVVAQ